MTYTLLIIVILVQDIRKILILWNRNIYSKIENIDLTNYLRDLPNLDVFTCDKNKYMLEINDVYSEDFYALLNNIEYEFYLDIVIYNDKLLIEGKLLDDIKEYIPYVRNSLISYLIVLPKNVKTKD